MPNVTRRTFLAGAAGLIAASTVQGSGNMQRNSAAPKFDLERFIDEVKRARREADSQKAVQEVLARAVSEPGAVRAVLGEPNEPGLHKLYNDKDLTILNIIWPPKMVLFPHDHRMWANIAIYTGREDNILWQRAGSLIEASKAASLVEQEIFPLPEDAIHSVVNPIDRPTGAIHVYGGDFFGTPRSEWDPETLVEKPYDVEEAKKAFKEANDRFKAGR